MHSIGSVQHVDRSEHIPVDLQRYQSHTRLLRPFPRRLMSESIYRNRLLVWLCWLIPVLTSCSPNSDNWDPQVLTARYTKNAQQEQLDLTKTAPTITIHGGDQLAFLSFALQLLPTRHTALGITITTIKDLPPPPETALGLQVRVSATARRWDGGGHCYDMKNRLVTDWAPVQAKQWEVRAIDALWVVADDWDEIRIDVAVRRDSTKEAETEHTINSIMLQPENTADRLRRNVEQNIFMRVMDSIRGVKSCTTSPEVALRAPSDAEKDKSYVRATTEVVYDTTTRLEWLAGPDEDIAWEAAKEWVAGLTLSGGGWRLPRVLELAGIYKKGQGPRNMTLLLKTTGWNVWSLAEDGDSFAYPPGVTAFCFAFDTGDYASCIRNFTKDRRVFAVRERKST